jgi:hypothetical protein
MVFSAIDESKNITANFNKWEKKWNSTLPLQTIVHIQKPREKINHFYKALG